LYRNYWNGSFAVLGLIAVAVLYYVVALWMRKTVNPVALQKGIEFRRFSIAHPFSATRKEDVVLHHAKYSLWTRLTSRDVTGIGTILHFRWQVVIMLWAMFGFLVFIVAGTLFWERLGIMHVPHSEKSYDACQENIDHQTKEFTKMEVVYFACTFLLYLFTFVGSLVLAYYQRLKFLDQDRDTTTMKDFAIFCQGFKEMDGYLPVEKIIRNQLRSQPQFRDLEIVTVSVAWSYWKERQQVEDLVDRELDALSARDAKEPEIIADDGDGNGRSCVDPYCFGVDAVVGIGDFPCASRTAGDEEEADPPEEITLAFTPRDALGLDPDPNTGIVDSVGYQSAIAGVQKGWRVFKVNGQPFTYDLLQETSKVAEVGDYYYITFLTDRERVLTFQPDGYTGTVSLSSRSSTAKPLGLHSYDDTGIVDEVDEDSQAYDQQVQVGWKMIQLSDKSLVGAKYSKQRLEELQNGDRPYAVTFSKEVPKLLHQLRSSPCCFVVFKSEAQKIQALANLKKNPLKIGSQEIFTREAICEPSTVVWKGFGSTPLKFYASAILGCFAVFFAVIFLDIFFYAPYVAYIYSYSNVPGMSQGSFLSNFLLSMLICVCNFLIYSIIGVITERCSWTNGDSKDCFYCVKYTLAVFFNTCLDLGTVLILAQGFSIDQALKQQIADDATMSTKAVAESPNMQRAIYEQLVAYIFPSCTLVPFLIEPFATTFGPFVLGSWLVRSRREVSVADAERCLQCPPFDLSRYGDIIVNMMLCCLTLVFTYPGLWMLFAYMIISCAVIYAWDHLRVLRFTTRTIFANNTMDSHVMYMMAMPCGTLLAAMTFKAYGASHQGFLEDLKRNFQGEYGVAPDRYNIFGYLMLAFFGHMLIHWSCLKFWIFPAADRHSEDEDPREPVRNELLKLADTPEKVFSMMGGTKENRISEDDFIKFLQDNKVRWQDTPNCKNESDVYRKFDLDGTKGICFGELFPPEYDHLGSVEGANWLTTNPVFCLRSKYVYKHKIPCTFFRMGKDHLIRKNVDIEQYFEGRRPSELKMNADFYSEEEENSNETEKRHTPLQQALSAKRRASAVWMQFASGA
jgi:hypothetical protein